MTTTITRRDWWAGIVVIAAALLLNSVQGLQSAAWTYWLYGTAVPPPFR
jgi:hypothetical protein